MTSLTRVGATHAPVWEPTAQRRRTDALMNNGGKHQDSTHGSGEADAEPCPCPRDLIGHIALLLAHETHGP